MRREWNVENVRGGQIDRLTEGRVEWKGRESSVELSLLLLVECNAIFCSLSQLVSARVEVMVLGVRVQGK